MNPSVPKGATIVLDYVGSLEAPKGYDTIYGNHQDQLTKPITAWTLDEVEADGPRRTKVYGSSAAGRYQFMRDTLDKPGTLKDIEGEMGLTGKEKFSPDLQDLMAFHLLQRRGWDKFAAGSLDTKEFAMALAKEWASLPVLADTQGAHGPIKRGDSYYDGDGRNKSLTKADKFEAVLEDAYAAARPKPATPKAPSPATPAAPEATKPPTGLLAGLVALLLGGGLARPELWWLFVIIAAVAAFVVAAVLILKRKS